MNKTTVRFVSVGAGLLLGALALALAQHDARESSESELVLAKPPSEQPQLIPVDDNPLWGHAFASSKTIVRANDDPGTTAEPPSLDYPVSQQALGTEGAPPSPLPQLGDADNPLRTGTVQTENGQTENVPPDLVTQAALVAPTADHYLTASDIQLAGGEGPPKSMPEIPSTMPAIQAQPIPSLASTGQSGPAGQEPGGDVIRAPKPSWTQVPAAMPAAPAFPGNPRPIASQSLSDTQSPAMPVTNLAPPATSNPNLQPAQTHGFPAIANPSVPKPILNQSPNQNLAAPNLNSLNATAPGLQTSNTEMPSAGPGQLITAPLGTTPGASSTERFNNGLPQPAPTATLGSAVPAGTGSQSLGNSPGFGGGSNRSPVLAHTILGRLISNQPGNPALDGSQNPVLLIQKRVAGECQVGKKTNVIITVRNAGNSIAQDVEVIDSVPNGASFAEAMPAVTPNAEGILIWKLGEMGPGDERTINLQIVPERQGEMGSTAAVRFAAQASMRTFATLPKLEMTFQSAPEVLIGSSHSIEVHVRNTGTGVARAVKLEADVPKALRHESGDTVLEALFGDIGPGESKRIRLDTLAVEPGPATVALRALTEDGVQQEQRADLQVLAPALVAEITGPNRRYLDRVATFQIMIKNTGTATATNCEFTMRLPTGLNFNLATQGGLYKADDHAVLWAVGEWPAGHAEAIELTVLPVEVGPQQMIFQGTADLGVKLEARGGLSVEEQGELTFSIDQDADPIELSASTTYTIEVRNVGRPDRNVELSLQLPPASEVLKVDASVPARVEGDVLRFDPIPQMDGRASQKFRIEVRHGKVGTQKVSAQLRSQNRPTLVIKEEATEVYNDRD